MNALPLLTTLLVKIAEISARAAMKAIDDAQVAAEVQAAFEGWQNASKASADAMAAAAAITDAWLATLPARKPVASPAVP